MAPGHPASAAELRSRAHDDDIPSCADGSAQRHIPQHHHATIGVLQHSAGRYGRLDVHCIAAAGAAVASAGGCSRRSSSSGGLQGDAVCCSLRHHSRQICSCLVVIRRQSGMTRCRIVLLTFVSRGALLMWRHLLPGTAQRPLKAYARCRNPSSFTRSNLLPHRLCCIVLLVNGPSHETVSALTQVVSSRLYCGSLDRQIRSS